MKDDVRRMFEATGAALPISAQRPGFLNAKDVQDMLRQLVPESLEILREIILDPQYDANVRLNCIKTVLQYTAPTEPVRAIVENVVAEAAQNNDYLKLTDTELDAVVIDRDSKNTQ